MSSGIAIAGEYATSLEGLNKREHSVVILKINKGMTAVEVDKVIKATPDSDPVAEWKNIIKQMPEGDCRYVISDFQFKETPTVTKSKIIMILWSPDDAPTKAKMIYAASMEIVVQQSKQLVQHRLQASEADDMEYSKVKKEVFN